MHVYIVTGGIGTAAMFSSLIERLAHKHGESIAIVSNYPDLFKLHPQVEASVSFNEPGFYDEVIIGRDAEIHHADPYYSNYIKGNTHLGEEWARLLGVPHDMVEADIFIDEYAMHEALRFSDEKGAFIVAQFSGGQYGSYPRELAQNVVDRIKSRNEGLVVVEHAPTQEGPLEGTIALKCPYMFYAALLQVCSAYVCIDDSILHLAGNRWNDRSGVAIWYASSPAGHGYPNSLDLTGAADHSMRPLVKTVGDSHNKDGSPWTPVDPTGTHVEPDSVIEAIEWSMDYNTKLKIVKDNVVIDHERRKRFVEVDPTTSQMLLSLRAQANGLNQQVEQTIERYVKSKKLDGKYVLSDDGKTLIKT